MNKLIASASIVFSIVLISAAIVYAGTLTWPSGSAPLAAPGAGNVQLAAITNAVTICPDDQFLQGDGSCLTAAQIVAAAGGGMYKLVKCNGVGVDGHCVPDCGTGWVLVSDMPISSYLYWTHVGLCSQ